jgi:YHS domain-containing protein
MMIDERAAAGTSVYSGHTYFFCSETCKGQFDRNPASFVAPADQRPNPSPDLPSDELSDQAYMRGGKGRRDEVGPTGIYPAGSPDVPASAPVREPGEFVRHAGGPASLPRSDEKRGQ